MRAHTFDVLICGNILLICSNSFWKFAAIISNLQQLYSIFSNFILFAARFFNLQQLFNLQHVPCGPPYLCFQKLLEFQQLPKTQVILVLNFTHPHALLIQTKCAWSWLYAWPRSAESLLPNVPNLWVLLYTTQWSDPFYIGRAYINPTIKTFVSSNRSRCVKKCNCKVYCCCDVYMDRFIFRSNFPGMRLPWDYRDRSQETNSTSLEEKIY